MSAEPPVSDQMREDWNRRAREDANYYVAFGRREQTDDEFFETAKEVVAGLEWELRRLGAGNPRARRALEIGCGPGRLLKPMSRDFGEIHGVDVSDEMIRLAREKLRGTPHAHAHATDGASLAMFADESFEVVYSYAVFQHIPSKEVVLEYLRETHRVLKPGGIFRAQFNGLPQDFPRYDTWSGVRFRADELMAFTRRRDFQMLALEGVDTQYMWTTWRKREPGWRERRQSALPDSPPVRIRRITNAHNSEPVAPQSGRYASVSVWVVGLPDDLDLFDAAVEVDGTKARATYIGPPDAQGLQQVNAILPAGIRTGLLPVRLTWFGRPISRDAALRVIPAGPQVPRIIALSDGINLLAGTRIETGVIKATLEELAEPSEFRATIDDLPVDDLEIFCTDPQPRRYEVNFKTPAALGPGRRLLRMAVGRRKFAPVPIEIAGSAIRGALP